MDNREVIEESSGKCRIILMQVKIRNQANRHVRIGWMQCNQMVFRKRRNTTSQQQSDPGCCQGIMESENREKGQNVVSKITLRLLSALSHALRHKNPVVVKTDCLNGKLKKKKDHWVQIT